jgi:prolipoprotein diacylglyceryltransferase
MIWNLAAAVLLIWLDKRYRWGHGRVFWAYVMAYTLGRVWIEYLRIDPAEEILGLRLNVWTSLLVGGAALVAFVLVGRRHPGREPSPDLPPATEAEAAADDPAADAEDTDEPAA